MMIRSTRIGAWFEIQHIELGKQIQRILGLMDKETKYYIQFEDQESNSMVQDLKSKRSTKLLKNLRNEGGLLPLIKMSST